MKTSVEFLLDADEVRIIEGMRLMPRKISGGRIRGDRLTRKKGVSIEFADFRDYVDGDDIRHLDWNVLARMESPVIRTYRDEEDIAIYVIVDCSPSMDFGDPTKLQCAKKLSAAIAFLALAGGDALHMLAAGPAPAPTRPLRGRNSFVRAASWLDAQTVASNKSLLQALHAFSSGKFSSGLVYIVSDGLDPKIADGVAMLAGRGHEVAFIQVLSREELDPDIEGDLRLVDSEIDSAVEITATGQTLRQYRANLDKHCLGLATTCVRYGGRYARLATDFEFGDFIKNVLRRERWVA